MPLQVTMQVEGFPAMKRKRRNDIFKATWLDLGKYWRKQMLPLHFTHRGGRKYGYSPRKGEAPGGGRPTRGTYTYRKKKLFGHTRPLEFTGKGKQEALTSKKYRATRDKVDVILPRKFNLRHPNSKVNMREEITAVTMDEITRLVRRFTNTLVRKMGTVNSRKTITVSGA